MIRAILWAQWNSVRILRFGGGRLGAVFSSLTSLLWYGFWVVAAIGVAAFTSIGQPAHRAALSFLLVFVVLYWKSPS
jgi:hypothetical protein